MIHLPTLPTFSSPQIRYSAPRWTARIPGHRATVEVKASSYAEARFAAARKFGCSAAVVVVARAYDPALSRFGARA